MMVERHDILHIYAKLDPNWIVQSVRLVESSARLRGCLLAKNCGTGLARYRTNEEEDNNHDPEENRDGEQSAAGDETEH